jgi:hypothetical protein
MKIQTKPSTSISGGNHRKHTLSTFTHPFSQETAYTYSLQLIETKPILTWTNQLGLAVNHWVAGSSPAGGAKLEKTGLCSAQSRFFCPPSY